MQVLVSILPSIPAGRIPLEPHLQRLGIEARPAPPAAPAMLENQQLRALRQRQAWPASLRSED
jgi:hypothetical protein